MKSRKKFHVLSIEGISEAKQGLIFYICRNLELLSPDKQRVINNLFTRVGGEHAAALRRFVTTETSAQRICTEYYIGSVNTLCSLRRQFYIEFPLDEIMRK